MLLPLLLLLGMVAVRAEAGTGRIITDKNVSISAAEGDHVLFYDAQSRSLVLHDLRTWQQRVIVHDLNVTAVAMSGQNYAYVDGDGEKGSSTLYLSNFGADTRVELARGGVITSLQFGGGKVGWAKPRSNVPVLFYSYDLASGTQSEVAQLPISDRYRSRPILFDGRYLVWADDWDLISLDTKTGQTQHKGGYEAPYVTGIDQGRVAFLRRNGAEEIMVWDLPANTALESRERRSTVPGSMPGPVIHGNQIAWAETTEPFTLRVSKPGEARSQVVLADGIPKWQVYLTNRYVVYVNTNDGAGLHSGVFAAQVMTIPDTLRLPNPPSDSRPTSFSDVGRDHWAAHEINLAVFGSYMRGYPDRSFHPESVIKRAEFLAILMRAYPKTGPIGESFSDVPTDHWAYTLINQARGLGLISGYANRFTPEGPITRAEMAVILQRLFKLPEGQGVAGFTDVTAEWQWAKPAIDVLSSTGLLNGFPDGSFKPSQGATRAQVAILLARLYK